MILVFVTGAFLLLERRTANIPGAGIYPREAKPSGQYLESYYKNRQDYEESFGKTNGASKSEVLAGITSHHFLARDLIARFFAGIDPQKVKRVILVGPDHFHSFSGGGDLAYVSKMPWKTPFGDAAANEEAVKKLLESGIGVKENNASFFTEHSIYALVPFLKHYLSEAEIIPLIIRNGNQYEEAKALGKRIREISGENSMLVVSSDFSHVASPDEARLADRKSIVLLDNLDSQNIGEVNCDCRNCLAAMSGFLGDEEKKFSLLENKTSADFGSREEKVTSYVSGYYTRGHSISSRTQDTRKILFVGDMMFDRHIREAVEKYGGGDYNYPLEPLKEKLSEYDLVVGNLEGPITENKSVSVATKIGEGKNFVFTFDSSVAGVLAENNIKLVNLGNNHILNQGEKGLEQTKKYLGEAGVEYFGDTGTKSPIGDLVPKDVNGIKVGFVSYNYSIPNSEETAIEEIKAAKEKSDIVIVCPHWGTEYKTGDPGNSIRTLAYRFIDAGADAVIGTHPHVIQNSEEYQGKKIYYSLGNFIFDQYFQKETMEGLGVEMTINPDRSMEFGELKFEMTKKGQTKAKL